MVQIREAKKGLSTHTRTHLHLPRRCRYARRSCAELASSTAGTGGRGTAPHSRSQLCPLPLRAARHGESPSGACRKKLSTKLPLPSTPSPVTLQKGGRYQLAACCRGQEPLGAERSLRDGRAPRARRRALLMAALPPAQPRAGTEHRASRPAPAAAAAAVPGRRHPGIPPAPPLRETCNQRRGSRGAHWPGGAGRGGTGRGLCLKRHRPCPAARPA